MKVVSISCIMMVFSFLQLKAQSNNTANGFIKNEDQNLLIGGYGEVHYNQELNSDTYNNGNLDVHRMVMLFGYKFTNELSFVTEIEYEHVKEVFIEQAFVNYKINNAINLRGGLMLVPMGIVNEYHEPTTFYSVERPEVDNKVVPSTWREIGFGATGNLQEVSLNYQLYVMNGFSSFSDAPTLKGSNGLRNGRQKGAESFISSPNLSSKVSYYGIKGLEVGLAGYFGKTQSSLYDGLDKKDEFLVAQADSSVVNVAMVGVDARYSKKGFHARGQYIQTHLNNTDAYNAFAGTDVGSKIEGYYLEAGYDVFSTLNKKSQLIPFARYEKYNLHAETAAHLTKNSAYDNTVITSGINWRYKSDVVLKGEFQMKKNEATHDWTNAVNFGIGVWFR